MFMNDCLPGRDLNKRIMFGIEVLSETLAVLQAKLNDHWAGLSGR